MVASRFVLLAVLMTVLLFGMELLSFVASLVNLQTLSGLSIAASVFVIAFLFGVIFVSLIAIVCPIAVKPFLIITTLINALALYYMVTYRVVLDVTMIGNIFNTKQSEAFELITPVSFVYFVLLGILPSWLILKIRISRINRVRIVVNLLLITASSILFLYVNSSSWLWIDKYSSLVGGKILPWSYIINTGRHYSAMSKKADNQILLPDGQFSDNQKVAVILVIGEAARAHNFSLYGYPVSTNPLLEKAGVLALKNTTSCTTYTTGSVACILAHDDGSSNSEPLPSYLTRLGADVIWRTSNWGEPTIKVTEYLNRGDLKDGCVGSGCDFDEVLLTNLSQRIQQSDKQKILAVLHTKGSHGPSYYARYPSEFERFTPVCRHEEISKCTDQALVNAYDNTILYTDHFLNQTIDQLKQLKGIPTLLIYISDHGESLGEFGLYLHGTPYAFAPDFQKDIPFLIWASDEYAELKGIDVENINQLDEYSQANIFHTIIGAFDLQTDIYDSTRDVLSRP
jgi:lipid A ethanolaminephosphotransferase